MIKITIIVILTMLLIITLYSYYCLSSSMIGFQKKRMEYILSKENELRNKEASIQVIADCGDKNNKYQQAIKGINAIIENIGLPPGSICSSCSNEEDKKTISNIKSLILSEGKESEGQNIIQEVPSEYIKNPNQMNIFAENIFAENAQK